MLPNVEFWGIDLYMVMICVGVFAAIIIFRILCDRKKLPGKQFNFFLIVVVCSVMLGFFSATLFQSFYNFLDSGVWEWKGMTFLGGLLGGLCFFFLLYFSIGHFVFRDRSHIARFMDFVCCCVPCVVIAHAFGRIGCLLDGCCYGIRSEALGLPMLVHGVWEKRLPTQLFESLFLFALFGVLVWLLLKKDCKIIPQIYLIAYGVWRFAIEFARDDPRGTLGIPFLTPSQIISILFVLAGIALLILPRLIKRKRERRGEGSNEQAP